jgi:hypothetical protein
MSEGFSRTLQVMLEATKDFPIAILLKLIWPSLSCQTSGSIEQSNNHTIQSSRGEPLLPVLICHTESKFACKIQDALFNLNFK